MGDLLGGCRRDAGGDLMAVISIFGGGLESSPTDGVKGVLGMTAAAAPPDGTLGAPRAGLRGLQGEPGTSLDVFIPSNAAIDTTVFFPANASRSWCALHFEKFFASAGITDGANYRAARIYFGTTVFRELRLHTQVNVSDATGTANAAVMTNDTTLTDTRVTWTPNQWIGKWCVCNGKKMKISSNTATVLTGTAGWVGGGNPGNGSAWQITTIQWWLEIIDNAGTSGGDTSSTYFEFDDTRTWVIDWEFKPTPGSVENKLSVDGVPKVSTTTGTSIDPTTSVVRYLIGRTAVAKTDDWANDACDYNGVFFDNLTQTDWDVFPPPYTQHVADRPFVTYRQPLIGQTPTYDQWTKVGDTDAAAVLDEIRDADNTDYIERTALAGGATDRQSWKMKKLINCDLPINSYDTVYALQTIGSNLGAVVNVYAKHTDGTTLDAGRLCEQVAPFLYCSYLAPDGTAWTPAKAELCESVAERSTNVAAAKIAVAGQLILAKTGNAPPLMGIVRQRPRQVNETWEA